MVTLAELYAGVRPKELIHTEGFLSVWENCLMDLTIAAPAIVHSPLP